MNSLEYIFDGYGQFSKSIDGFNNDVGWGCTIRSFQMMVKKASIGNDIPCHPIEVVIESSEEFGGVPGEWFPQLTVCNTLKKINSRIQTNTAIADSYPVLVLLPTRLDSTDSLSDKSMKIIDRFFKNQYAVGIAGGMGQSSHFYVGLSGQDTKPISDFRHFVDNVKKMIVPSHSNDHMIVYLDPHKMNDDKTNLEKIPLRKLNPCMTFGWLCHWDEDLYAVYQEFKDLFDTSFIELGESTKEFQLIEEDDMFIVDM